MLPLEVVVLVAAAAALIALWYWYQSWHADKRLVHMMPDKACLVDANGVVLQANGAMLELLGLEPSKALGVPLQNLMPDWQDMLKQAYDKDLHVELTHKGQDYELLSYNYHMDSKRRTLITVRNITDRKRAQKAIQNYLEKMSMLHQVDNEVSATLDLTRSALLAMDAGLRTSGADAGFLALLEGETLYVRHMFGAYKRVKVGDPVTYDMSVVGRVLELQEAQFISDVSKDKDYVPDIPNIRAAMVLPLVAQAQLIGIMYLETKDPNRFNELLFDWMKVVVARLSMALENARLYKIVRQQLDETRQLYDEKSRLEQLKTDMIRIASHDLKNPVSVIQGYLTLMDLDKDRLNAEHQGFLREMQRATDRMFSILEDILSLERLQQHAETHCFDLVPLLLNAYNEYASPARLRRQVFTLEGTDGAQCWVNGNEKQLYEALTNLISNAIKYTPEGGEIRVVLTQDNAAKTVTVRVIDNGYGIPEDRQQRLFEPFYRAKTEETINIEGTGLGLHLVKNIIERFHGKLFFESVYQQGSTFGFTLPTVPKTE